MVAAFPSALLCSRALVPEPPASDEGWAAAAARGDPGAFGRLVQRHGARVHALCRRLLADSEEARDAAQEAFARAYEALSSYDGALPFLPWLLRIARNHCLDALRRRAARRAVAPAAAEVDLVDPVRPADEALAGAEAGRALWSALARLPEPQREALVLHHMEQLPTREVAAVLGVPHGTVLTWLHRGRHRLREELEEAR